MSDISWKLCQENSDKILAEGLELLRKNNEQSLIYNDIPNDYGNYIISDESKFWNYIGESNNLIKRIKQQSNLNRSTFYKNYRKMEFDFNSCPTGLSIDDFKVRTIITNIGRKEIEEFGIVNIPTNLNKFQKNKRIKYSKKTKNENWLDIQSKYLNLLEDGESHILNKIFDDWNSAMVPPVGGIYWVVNISNELIYIGESSNIKERYITHSGITYFSALRRHIGENILKFTLQTRNCKKRYFSPTEDNKVTEFLFSCKLKFMEVRFGRFELEEYLIAKYNPILNRK